MQQERTDKLNYLEELIYSSTTRFYLFDLNRMEKIKSTLLFKQLGFGSKFIITNSCCMSIQKLNPMHV